MKNKSLKNKYPALFFIRQKMYYFYFLNWEYPSLANAEFDETSENDTTNDRADRLETTRPHAADFLFLFS